MSNEPGLSISKPTSVLKKSIKVNFTDFSKALGKGLVDLGFGKWDSLAGDGVEALSALGLAANAEEIAWLLVYRSLLQAMKNLIDEKTELEPGKFDVKALQTRINKALETSSLTINKKFFEHPDKDSIVEAVKPAFVEWLKQCGLSEADAQAISDRLPIYFAAALQDEWGNHAKDYAVLRERLDTPFTQANERVQAWLRYATWLQKQVEEPMFLEAFSLKRVYVPLRAYYNRKVEGQKCEELEGRLTGSKQLERVVVDLEKELETWLSKTNKDDAIRLISGGPGSGKSSFAKMFAANLAAKGMISVLFIPLHHFDPSDDLINAVGKFVQMDGILPHNPLVAEHRESRLLIVFDGLDELAMQGKIAEKTAQDFVREVQRKVERFNQREICLQVLISGRELVVQANETDFRKEGQILHVLPYFVAEDDREDYVDAKKLLEQDQRQLWWQNYGVASGSGYTGLPTELDQGNLTEITAQPLLNYLVALSLQRGELKFSEETNLNAVYADLLKAIYERGWAGHQHAAIQGIEKKDFVRILEEIALAAWHGNGRTTTVEEIERHCENSNLKNLLSRFQEGFREDSKASITRLLTAFYFRQSGHDHAGNKTFEFTHKSFGEYLVAKRVVREVRLISKKLEERQYDPDEGWDERDALYRWALLCGSSNIDEYLLDFIKDEMRLENKLNLEQWQQTLCNLIGFMLEHGMPMERVSRYSFLVINFMARNSEEALLLVLNACACLTKLVSKIKHPELSAFGSWLSRLNSQRVDGDSLPLKCLKFLDLQSCILYVKDLINADLEGTNLKKAKLGQANFASSNLKQVILEEADLFSAKLEDANLEEANLEAANLEGANFNQATLKRTNLKRAKILGTLFIDANLEEADLREADLQYTNFLGANLYKADLRKANLKEVYFENANLENARLEGANLEKVNFNGANLKGTILEGKIHNQK
ncbi:pentapeptide repeat-containing protein [Aerosakkonemataceae cyanobacterium BLCC-F50]|uniref:Pentapeptide repeat-containing protein n=1 Tax=Floridaenema flaviceps BLCC-F50 TaxID=3153642 RepID=A0ABV4XYC3_9CYAN